VGEGKPGFFAIASPPDPNNQGLLEFLIKAQGEAAEALAGARQPDSMISTVIRRLRIIVMMLRGFSV
jgi:hypothetical protein